MSGMGRPGETARRRGIRPVSHVLTDSRLTTGSKLFGISAETIFRIEREVVPAATIDKVRGKVESMIRRFTDELSLRRGLSPEDKLKLVWDVLEKKLGFQFKQGTTFSLSIAQSMIDTHSFSLLCLILAKKAGWPLKMTAASGRYFVRWESARKIFNCGLGEIFTDKYCIEEFGLDKKSVEKGVYLGNMSQSEIESSIYSNCGVQRLIDNDFAEAERLFTLAIGLNPKDVEAHNGRATARLWQSNLKGTKADAVKIIEELDPRYEEACVMLGTISYLCADHAEAEAFYSKAIVLNPDFIHAYQCRGIVRLNTNNFKGALEDYEKIFKELDPADVDARVHSGIARIGLGDTEGAIAVFEQVVGSIDPNNALAYFWLAKARYKLGQVGEARRAWEKSIRLDPLMLKIDPENGMHKE